MKTNAWLAGLTCGLSLWAAGAAPAAWAVSPGDAIRGEAVYSRCLACHALAYDRHGPRQCGLFGRQAGTGPGSAYIEAMRESEIVWAQKTPNLMLQHTMKAVP